MHLVLWRRYPVLEYTLYLILDGCGNDMICTSKKHIPNMLLTLLGQIAGVLLADRPTLVRRSVLSGFSMPHESAQHPILFDSIIMYPTYYNSTQRAKYR